MPTITISLPESLRVFIEQRVSKGAYGTVSEYLRDLIRNDQKFQAQLHLESLLLEGLESGTSEMTTEDWTEIREEVRRRQAERGNRKTA